MKSLKNLRTSILNESRDRDSFSEITKRDFKSFLKELDAMSQWRIEDIMGKESYIDTPGDWRDQDRETRKSFNNNIEEYYETNMGKSEFKKLKTWWESNIKNSVEPLDSKLILNWSIGHNIIQREQIPYVEKHLRSLTTSQIKEGLAKVKELEKSVIGLYDFIKKYDLTKPTNIV